MNEMIKIFTENGVEETMQEENNLMETIGYGLRRYLNPEWFSPGTFEMFIIEIVNKLKSNKGLPTMWTLKIKGGKSCGLKISSKGIILCLFYKSWKGTTLYDLSQSDISRAAYSFLEEMFKPEDDEYGQEG